MPKNIKQRKRKADEDKYEDEELQEDILFLDTSSSLSDDEDGSKANTLSLLSSGLVFAVYLFTLYPTVAGGKNKRGREEDRRNNNM